MKEFQIQSDWKSVWRSIFRWLRALQAGALTLLPSSLE